MLYLVLVGSGIQTILNLLKDVDMVRTVVFDRDSNLKSFVISLLLAHVAFLPHNFYSKKTLLIKNQADT